ncbi:MAG TPA: cytochrome c biogenesis protein CcdC [Polyangiales bacterium]|nr:cytochrome c biogenesis protein CcdC [Polyangiales bacterium]
MTTWMLVSSLIGAALVMAYRVRESTRPITARKIVIPPLAMSTGFGMFAYPPARIPPLWAASAFLCGALILSYPLVKTSKLMRVGDLVMLKRSKAFLWILIGLVAIRLALRGYVGQYVDPLQTASLFFVLAFGMIVVWRVRMLIEYRQLVREPAATAPLTAATRNLG